MVITKTLSSGEQVEVTSVSGAGTPGRSPYFSVFGTPQNVVDFLTEERIPEQKIKGATYTSNSELCVLYCK